ncbi:MAG TPA: glycosyltransferase [Anaerolineales bacterium]
MLRFLFMGFRNIIPAFHILLQNRIISRLRPPSPARLRVFYIGGYWRGPNDMVAQMLAGLKSLGVNVCEFNTDKHRDALDTRGIPYDRGTSGPVWLVGSKVLPSLLRFRPHLVICNAGGLSFRRRDVIGLRLLGVRLLGIALSDPDVYSPTTSRIARNFDVFYSNDKGCVELYRQSGVQAYRLPIATNSDFFRPMPPKPEYRCEVLVLGAVHEDRIEPVKALVEHFNTHLRGENWEQYGIPNRGTLFGEEALSALNSARMAIIFSRTITGHRGLKVGVFDFLSAGCLVLTDDIPELHEYFEVGKEVVAFQGLDDMLAKIRYYLDHPQEADAVRRAGRQRVLAHYTWDKVWPRVLASVLEGKAP